MSDSEIKEFGLARLKEDIDGDGNPVKDTGEGVRKSPAYSEDHVVLVTKMPSREDIHIKYSELASPTKGKGGDELKELRQRAKSEALAAIDLGSIERMRCIEVPLGKLEAYPEVEKTGWIADLEKRCREEYGELYTEGTNLEYNGVGGTQAFTLDRDTVQSKYQRTLGRFRSWKKGDPIRLISGGMVDSETYPGYIGFVKTKIQLSGYLWGDYDPEDFLFLPPESLEVVPSQESQAHAMEKVVAAEAELEQAEALTSEWMGNVKPGGLEVPLLPPNEGGGRKRKMKRRKTKRRKTKRRKTKRKTKRRGTKKM